MWKFINSLFGLEVDEETETWVKEGAFLVDVRTPEEFNAGHVSGSVNIPLDTISEQLRLFKNKERIVVFCRTGRRSGIAMDFLNKNGIHPVRNGKQWTTINKLVEH